MVPESALSLSGDDFEFDIDFEFDAPRFYDFSRPELDSETEEIEIWFQSAGNYPPSRKTQANDYVYGKDLIMFSIQFCLILCFV